MTATLRDDGMIVIETADRIHIAGVVDLLDARAETASWASPHVQARGDFGYIVGRYVMADEPNRNGHIFKLDDLRAKHQSVVHTALNMVHDYNHVIGTYVAAHLFDEHADPAAAALEAELDAMARAARKKMPQFSKPHVQTVAAVWRFAFPGHYAEIEKAYEKGALWQSMECVPATITCVSGCAEGAATFAYRGPRHDSYCDHVNARQPRTMDMPHFTGGAAIIPPVRPGWADADVTEVAAVIAAHLTEAEQVYDHVAALSPELDSDEWEAIMGRLLAGAFGPVPHRTATVDRDYSRAKREQLLSEGKALPGIDGGAPRYPIDNVADLTDAISAFGRARDADRGRVRNYIIRRARALGRTDLLPEDWSTDAFVAAALAAEMPPPNVLDAYVTQREDCGLDTLGDPPLAAATAISASVGRLWQLSDGTGQWYFVEAPSGDVRWVGQKWPDVFAWHVAEEIAWTKADVRRLGWGDAAWQRALAQSLAGESVDAFAEDARLLEIAAAGSGVIVAAVPPPAIRDQLAALGTEPADALHITLAFLGRVERDVLAGEHRDLSLDELCAAVGTFCAAVSPVQAKASGLGRFSIPDGSEVTYASVDAPGLGALRARLVAAFDAVGVPVARDHDFTAHITIHDGEPGSGPTTMPSTELTWTIDALEVWWGPDHRAFPLLGAAVPA